MKSTLPCVVRLLALTPTNRGAVRYADLTSLRVLLHHGLCDLSYNAVADPILPFFIHRGAPAAHGKLLCNPKTMGRTQYCDDIRTENRLQARFIHSIKGLSLVRRRRYLGRRSGAFQLQVIPIAGCEAMNERQPTTGKLVHPGVNKPIVILSYSLEVLGLIYCRGIYAIMY